MVDVTIPLTGTAVSAVAGKVAVASSASGYVIFTAAAKRHARRAIGLDNLDLARNLDAGEFSILAGDLIDAALAAVLAACSAMEATINELFLAKELGTVANIRGLDTALATQLGDAWNAGVEKLGIIEKAGIVSAIVGKGALDLGRPPMQAGGLLVSLRNELVHHKPKWVQHGVPSSESSDKLELELPRFRGQFSVLVL